VASRNQKLIVAAVVTVFLCGAAFALYLGYQTFSHMGEDAVAQMSGGEREWLARVGKLHRGMSAAEVERLLGEPSVDMVLAAKWDGFAGSRLSQLRIYYHDGQPRRLRWMKIGYFVYEKDL
jgi:hypothetical protein